MTVYRVFFADDEAAMRDGLRNSITCEGSRFALVGEAPDGELALSMIAETTPDILITDVRMPFMDGIELSRRVARTMPWVRIIILSGHDEFEYAKQAIKIGVTEYLLKPITSPILFQALENAARAIDAERERRRAFDALRVEASDARVLKLERELSNMVYGISDDMTGILSNMASFASMSDFRVAIFEIEPSEDDGAILARAGRAISETLSPNENIAHFPEGAGRVVAVFAAENEETLEEETYAAARAAKYDAERSAACSVSAAIGVPVQSVLSLPKSMSAAKRALRYIENSGGVILEYGDIDRENRGKGKKNAPASRTSRYGDIIEKSREYIANHYSDGSISLNSVAEHVGMSPNHFSTIFSQETGETFIDRLTSARLERAKELLRTTSAKASEIAYMVGYNDPHYFSYVFKKNVGVSPSDYRR
ncbi:MAG: response regulator [Synergistaceae bacterium]|jgi:two-component system response regulator YesN|nr:response regulator [Synergistaceae bacterium]